MLREKYEIVIIGAGPAGLAAAEVLAKAKKKVIVFERETRVGKKICAGGLSIKNDLIGVPLNSIGDKFFNSLKYHFYEKTKDIFSNESIIVITEREKLENFILKKAKKSGAEVRFDSNVSEIKNDFIVVDNKKIYFEYLIGADGSNSLVRNFLNIPLNKFLFSLCYNVPAYYKNLEIFFDSKIFGDGYGAIFPHKEYTQIGITVDSSFCTMKEAKKMLDKWIKNKKFNIRGGEFMAGIINYDYRGFKFDNKFLVGDAGGFASGFTGEGIFQAIVSGREIAKKIINSSYGCSGINHILTLKFLQEKFLKKLLKTKNKLISNIVFNFLVFSADPNHYKRFFKLKNF